MWFLLKLMLINAIIFLYWKHIVVYYIGFSIICNLYIFVNVIFYKIFKYDIDIQMFLPPVKHNSELTAIYTTIDVLIISPLQRAFNLNYIIFSKKYNHISLPLMILITIKFITIMLLLLLLSVPYTQLLVFTTLTKQLYVGGIENIEVRFYSNMKKKTTFVGLIDNRRIRVFSGFIKTNCDKKILMELVKMANRSGFGTFNSYSNRYGLKNHYYINNFGDINLSFVYTKGISGFEPLLVSTQFGHKQTSLVLAECTNIIKIPYVETNQHNIDSRADFVNAMAVICQDKYDYSKIYINKLNPTDDISNINPTISFKKLTSTPSFQIHKYIFENNLLENTEMRDYVKTDRQQIGFKDFWKSYYPD